MAPSCLHSAALLTTLASLSIAQTGPTSFVDTQIGATNLGHVFAGASLPYGMAKAVADTTDNNRGGFSLDGNRISGFSHMHDTGTGGGSSMGNFPLFAYAGCSGDTPNGCAPFTKLQRAVPFDASSIMSSPGYWSIKLNTGVQGDMTTTEHTALYRFTFPETPAAENATLAPFIISDLTDLYDSVRQGTINVDPNTGRMTGSGSFGPSFGEGSYPSYFCTDFGGASLTAAGIWTGARTTNSTRTTGYGSSNTGAWARFAAPDNGNRMFARVGVSLISIAQACSNAQSEMPNFTNADFEDIRAAADQAWNDKLAVVSVSPGTLPASLAGPLQTLMYSGIYRAMISPQDYTGENPRWNSNEPFFDSYYCIWDSFRAQHPLLTVVDPVQQTRMIRSLIDIYRNEGYIPDCHMQLNPGYVQGGSNADIVMADAYLKGLADGIDWPTAFQGVVKDAEVEPYEWLTAGRGHLANYKKLGYCPQNDNDTGYGLGGSTVSRTVEYAYDDYAIAAMAKKMGNTAALAKYRKRSQNWKNLFNNATTSRGFTGFLQPRLLNGKFGTRDPTRGSPANSVNCCGSFSADIDTYEGSCWSYSFYAPQDMASLIVYMGGPATFVRRLDYMHENNLLDIGNEQGFLNVYQYHYAGRPGRSTYRIHQYIPRLFNVTANGIPGNDDSGAIGSFTSWSMMGLWPIPGQVVYLISTPFFPSVSVKNPVSGATAIIRVTNFDPTYKAIYVQSAKLNGQAYTKSYVTHGFFTRGGTLELTVGRAESKTWGVGKANIPPSFSTNGIIVNF